MKNFWAKPRPPEPKPGTRVPENPPPSGLLDELERQNSMLNPSSLFGVNPWESFENTYNTSGTFTFLNSNDWTTSSNALWDRNHAPLTWHYTDLARHRDRVCKRRDCPLHSQETLDGRCLMCSQWRPLKMWEGFENNE
jgi:hypothetical protein